jgi:hypothetical protein
VLDGAYRGGADEALFPEARAPTGDELDRLLDQIAERLVRMLTRTGYLVERQGVT